MAVSLADEIFNRIFLNENVWVANEISQFSKGPINNKPTLLQVLAWGGKRDKPLPEPKLTQFIDTIAALGGDELIVFSQTDCLLWREYAKTTNTAKLQTSETLCMKGLSRSLIHVAQLSFSGIHLVNSLWQIGNKGQVENYWHRFFKWVANTDIMPIKQIKPCNRYEILVGCMEVWK